MNRSTCAGLSNTIFFRHKAPERFFEGGPSGIDDGMLHASLKHPPAHGREIAIITQLLQRLGRQRLEQKRLQCSIAGKPLTRCLVQPLVIKCWSDRIGHGGY
jgi:hypothetical protein